MADEILQVQNSLVQHGKENDRIYLMKLSKEDYPDLMLRLLQLAQEKAYAKLFVKVPKWAESGLCTQGYRTEAEIPQFFQGTETACFMAYYLQAERGELHNRKQVQDVLIVAKNSAVLQEKPPLPATYTSGILTPQDAVEMAKLYGEVFATYPFPIHDPAYLRQTMQENIVYFGIRTNGKLVAVSSCEMDVQSKNVEMTDFATLPAYRAKGLASYLLWEMEAEMRRRHICTAYTIARAVSYGMNITFAKHGYTFSGTLVNNTNIAGTIESMHVWHKTL